jgi:hypothetical protein
MNNVSIEPVMARFNVGVGGVSAAGIVHVLSVFKAAAKAPYNPPYRPQPAAKQNHD